MINVRLSWPPTANHYYTVARGRKILSSKGRRYKQNAILSLMEQRVPKGLTGRLEVRIDVYPPDKRKRDIANLEKAVVDACQQKDGYGIFIDDAQIDILHIRRLHITKPGHVRVYISEI